jgi:hypothetical protein
MARPPIFAVFRRLIRNVSATVLALGLSACTDSPPASAPAPDGLTQPAPGSPRIEARRPEDVATAAKASGRFAAASPAGRRLDPAAAPFLHAAPGGRAYLALPTPRALARGEPAARCPALAAAPGPTPSAAAEAALGACFGQLRDRGAEAGCGCRILALDGALVAPQSEFAYAPGVGARILGGDPSDGRPLVAIERTDGDPALVEVAFLDALGPVAVARLGAGGDARLLTREGPTEYAGVREMRGWRRGRMTERLLLRSADGRRLIALIGFEPADIAAEGAALARWPVGTRLPTPG